MAFKRVLADYLGKLGEILSGDTIHPDQLGTGTRDGSKILQDDGTWVTAGEGAVYTGDKTIDGRTLIGATTTETPFDLEYVEKIGDDSLNIAHTRIYGATIQNRIFDDSNIFTASSGDIIYVDWVGGVDGLVPTAYLGAVDGGSGGTPATVSTPSFGYKFKTLEAAINWVNTSNSHRIQIRIENTTIGSRLTLTDNIWIWNKKEIVITTINISTTQYIDLGSFYISCFGSVCAISRLNINVNTSYAFKVNDGGQLSFGRDTINFLGTSSALFEITSGWVLIDRLTNIIFGANNQVLVHPSGGGGDCNLIITDHTPLPTFTVGSYTGLLLNTSGFGLELFIPSLASAIVLTGINLSNTRVTTGESISLGVSSYDSSLFDYELNLGTTKPLRFTDLNSSSSNLSYTTKKKLIVNQLGEVGVLDDTGGGDPIIAIDVKSVDLRGVLDTGTNGVGTTIFGYTVVLGDKVLLQDINGDWGIFTVGASSMTLTSQDSIVHVSNGSYSGYIYSYDNFNGQYRLVGDNATITGIITLDFGNEDNKAFNQIDITGTGLLNESEIKNISIIPQETTETSIDDFVLNNVSFFISNLNNSFDTIDIIGMANNGASGVYTVRYTITY